jgi:hypothetical protein
LRQAVGRTLLAVVAIGLGVALGFSVYLINRVAADEVQLASRSLFGMADLSVQAPGLGFDENLFPRLAAIPGVAVASPVIEAQARLPGRDRTLKLVGIDPFRAARLQPALVTAGASAGQDQTLLAEDAVWLSPAAAQAATGHGVVRLAALASSQQHDLVARQCAADREMALLTAAAGFDRRLFAEIADRAVANALRLEEQGIPRAEAAFTARVEVARADIANHGEQVARAVKAVLLAVKEVRASLEHLQGPVFAAGREAVLRQLETLLAPGWVRDTPAAVFGQLPKYVKTAARRAQRLRDDVNRDHRLDAQVAPFEAAWRSLVAAVGPEGSGVELDRLRWMIEEFRLSLFAQDLRTLGPVSAKRLDAQVALARDEAAGG